MNPEKVLTAGIVYLTAKQSHVRLSQVAQSAGIIGIHLVGKYYKQIEKASQRKQIVEELTVP